MSRPRRGRPRVEVLVVAGLWFGSMLLLGWLFVERIGPSWARPVYLVLAGTVFWLPRLAHWRHRRARRRHRPGAGTGAT